MQMVAMDIVGSQLERKQIHFPCLTILLGGWRHMVSQTKKQLQWQQL